MWMSKRDISKKWRRIKYSQTTKLFAATLTIQTLLVAVLQIRMAVRDSRLIKEAYGEMIYDLTCVRGHFDKSTFTRMGRESTLILYIQLFLFLLGLDAVIRQYTPQIKTFTLLNLLVMLFGFTQLTEIKINIDEFNKNCGRYRPLDAGYLTNEIPNVVITFSTTILMGYLAYRLIREFRGLVYRKIGADKRMQKMFKTRLLFIMLLRINMFFVLFMLVPTLALIIVSVQKFNAIGKIALVFSILHIFFSAFAFRMLYITSGAVKKENGRKLRQFSRTWILVLIDWAITLALCFIRGVIGPSFIFLSGIPFTFLGVVLIKCTANVILTFNTGYKEYVGQYVFNRKMEISVIKVYDDNHPELEKPAPAVVADRNGLDGDTGIKEDDENKIFTI